MLDLGDTVAITPDELGEIFDRLRPHLPPNLIKIEADRYKRPYYEFTAFTGQESEPSRPRAVYDDPRLTYVREDVDPHEHKLRWAANQLLDDIYQQAGREWKDAAYVADLKAVIADAPDRWRTHERELKALKSAYAYLRTPEAGAEWPAAVCRLVDAQKRASEAAARFDERGQEIAQVHEQHLHADLSPVEALARAGHPEARHWRIADVDDYGSTFYSGQTDVSANEIVRRLIVEQDAHVARVSSLTGGPAAN